MLTIDSPKVVAFLQAWHDNLVMALKKDNLACEANLHNAETHAHEGTKFIRLDMGGSGHFMVDRETEIVYSIKGYGVVNYKKPRGTIEFLTGYITDMTAKGENYTRKWWYKLHPTS